MVIMYGHGVDWRSSQRCGNEGRALQALGIEVTTEATREPITDQGSWYLRKVNCVERDRLRVSGVSRRNGRFMGLVERPRR